MARGINRRITVYIRKDEWEDVMRIKREYEVSWRDIIVIGAREIERLEKAITEHFARYKQA